MGLCRLGLGLLLPAVHRLRWHVPDYYRPYYPTYGYSAWYNPWTGSYGRGAAVYGPYGGAGVGARYNPSTGVYSRGAAAYGPYGGAAVGSGLQLEDGDLRARRRRRRTLRRPRRGRSLQSPHRSLRATRQGSGVYGSWGQTGVTRGDDWAQTSRVTNNAPERRRA